MLIIERCYIASKILIVDFQCQFKFLEVLMHQMKKNIFTIAPIGRVASTHDMTSSDNGSPLASVSMLGLVQLVVTLSTWSPHWPCVMLGIAVLAQALAKPIQP